MSKMLMKNSKGETSATYTAFVVGFLIVNIKLLLSGITVFGVSFGIFSGIDYGAAVAALGGVYVMRRSSMEKGGKEE